MLGEGAVARDCLCPGPSRTPGSFSRLSAPGNGGFPLLRRGAGERPARRIGEPEPEPNAPGPDPMASTIEARGCYIARLARLDPSPQPLSTARGLPLILILKSNATDEQIDHVLERVEALGLQHHLSRGTYRTIVGIIGDEEKLREEPLRAIPGVAKVVPVLPPYKLASRDAHPEPSVIDVSGVKIGGGHLGMIAGPCSVEDRDRMFRIAESVSRSGANLFRGGAFKPRTSPYAFQGMGEEGLKLLARSG